MSATFRCWLIANFEIVMFWLTLTAELFVIVAGYPQWSENESKMGIPFYSLVGTLLCLYPYKRIGTRIVGSFIGGGILLTMLMSQQYVTDADKQRLEALLGYTPFFIAGAIATGTVMAVYSYRHINEVRSRRMRYRHSNVELFSHAWSYSLERFTVVTITILFSAFWFSVILITSKN